jgi:hypothetical protein
MNLSLTTRTKKIALCGGLIAVLGTAYAAEHFLYVTSNLSGTNAVVSFKEAGLGNTVPRVDYTAAATVDVVWVCSANGKTCPRAANKTATSSPVTSSGSFSPKNGSVEASLTLSVPATSPASLACGSGQTPTVQSVIYKDITITDVTNSVGPEDAVPSTLSATLFNCKG